MNPQVFNVIISTFMAQSFEVNANTGMQLILYPSFKKVDLFTFQ